VPRIRIVLDPGQMGGRRIAEHRELAFGFAARRTGRRKK